MKRLDEFRIYYNHTIHPELLRLERSRLRLLRLLFFSSILLTSLIILEFYINILLVTLGLMIPIGLYITFLVSRIRKFQLKFKPHIMNLVLDFIDDDLNFGTLTYEPNKLITKDKFQRSRIFSTKAPYYKGEDYITGMIGEMEFELSELFVKETSPVRSGLEYVFKGIFLHAIFNEETDGSIVVWPREYRQYLTRSMKAFTRMNAVNVDEEILNLEFREHFMTFATEDTHVISILSEPMQEAIMKRVKESGKEIYMSFINKEIYAAITEPKDILEPFIFRSNLSFEIVREFFEDISLALSLIEDFDQTH